MICFFYGGSWYFVHSAFDDVDDYPDSYYVYRLPLQTEEAIREHPTYWVDLTDDSLLGRIPISEVGLDESRRKCSNADAFASVLASGRE